MRFGMHEAGHTVITERLSVLYFYGGKGTIAPGWYVEDVTKAQLVSGPHAFCWEAMNAARREAPVELH